MATDEENLQQIKDGISAFGTRPVFGWDGGLMGDHAKGYAEEAKKQGLSYLPQQPGESDYEYQLRTSS